jgi:hypothetical protein
VADYSLKNQYLEGLIPLQWIKKELETHPAKAFESKQNRRPNKTHIQNLCQNNQAIVFNKHFKFPPRNETKKLCYLTQ